MLAILSSPQVAELTGISFRQIDYLVSKARIDLPNQSSNPGRGRRRLWAPDYVRRLQVGVALGKKLADNFSAGAMPVAVQMVMAGPPPYPSTWVALVDGAEVHYAESLDDVDFGSHLIMARVPALWPDVDQDLYQRVMALGVSPGRM